MVAWTMRGHAVTPAVDLGSLLAERAAARPITMATTRLGGKGRVPGLEKASRLEPNKLRKS